MQQDEIRATRDELNAIYTEAIDYFNKHRSALDELVETISEKNEAYRRIEMFRAERHYWEHISELDRIRADELTAQLINVMNKILLAVKASPLTEEADYRELTICTKQMRAALHFRTYRHWDADAIHDEGTILAVTPAGQAEEESHDIEAAKQEFKAAFTRAQYVINLVTPGDASSAQIVYQNSQPATKYNPNTAFIMMWMNKEHPELDDVRDTIKAVFESFGIRAVRADDIEHEDVITKRILDAISSSEFLIADLTGERPSVYYEVGYAHALKKRVILYRKKDTSLHFDLAGYNCPEYENLRDLKEQLTKRLQIATNKNPSS